MKQSWKTRSLATHPPSRVLLSLRPVARIPCFRARSRNRIFPIHCFFPILRSERDARNLQILLLAANDRIRLPDFREKERERDCVPKEFSFRFNELIKSIKTSFISAIFDGRNVHVKGTSYSRRSRGISKLCRQNLRMTHRFMRWL